MSIEILAILATYTNADVMLVSVRTGVTSAYVSSNDNCTFTIHTHRHRDRDIDRQTQRYKHTETKA